MSRGERLLWRNRFATLALVAGFLAATIVAFPDRSERASFQYFFVVTLGYGHLIGGLVFSWRRLSRPTMHGVSSWPFRALLGSLVGSAFVVYGHVVARSPGFFFLMLGISSWHIFENDLALGRSYRSGFRTRPMPRTAEHHLAALGLTGAVAALSWATLPSVEIAQATAGSWLQGLTNRPGRIAVALIGALLLLRQGPNAVGGVGVTLVVAMAVLPPRIEGVPWFGFSEVFSAVTLYHLVGWLIFFADRSREVRTVPVARKLLALHVAPAIGCVAVHASAEPGSVMTFWVLSPAIYLFWSVLHVFQTAWVRGVEARTVAA